MFLGFIFWNGYNSKSTSNIVTWNQQTPITMGWFLTKLALFICFLLLSIIFQTFFIWTSIWKYEYLKFISYWVSSALSESIQAISYIYYVNLFEIFSITSSKYSTVFTLNFDFAKHKFCSYARSNCSAAGGNF